MKISTASRPIYQCDRCGTKMIERSCKISCPNCGNRFDCSDLTVHMTPISTEMPPITTRAHDR